jgi:putative hemolysin
MNLAENNKTEFTNLVSKLDLHGTSLNSTATPFYSSFASDTAKNNEQSSKALGITIKWATTQDEVRAAQRLRFTVFTKEMGARLPLNSGGLDTDLFDDYCEHLIVQDTRTLEVIGTYRALTPTQALRIGSLHLETSFDLTRLRQYREKMVEIGKGCVHPEHRNGGVIMALWGELFRFMQRNQLDIMSGSTPIPMTQEISKSARSAASIWSQLKKHHLAPIEFQIRTRDPLPIEQLNPHQDLHLELPPLIQAYLRLGAKVLGVPAWLANSNSVDVPMMMSANDLHHKYQKHFLGL